MTTTKVPTKNDKTEEGKNTMQEKVRAEDDVIAYAETNKVEKKEEPEKASPISSVSAKDVTALSRYIYLHNLNDPTPTVEAIVYKAIAPGTSNVVQTIDEKTFETLRVLPKLKGHIYYNYVDGMLKNNPAKGTFYHRTFTVSYPEWIKPEDVQKQAQQIVSHYGIPDLSSIEKVLWPDFTGKVVKQSLSEDVTEDAEE